MTYVFLPGMHGTHAPSALFLGLLRKKGKRVLPLDLPPKGAQDGAALLPWLQGALKGIGPHTLIAESFSGPIALSYAAFRPKNLRRIVLLGSFARSPLSLGPLAALLPPLPFHWRIFDLGTERMLFSGKSQPGQLGLVRSELAKTGAWVLRRRLQEVLRLDLRPLLPALTVPVLAVMGSRDRLVGAWGLKSLQGLRKLKVLSIDAPHFMSLTHAAALAKAI